MTTADLRLLFMRYRVQSEALGVAAFAVIVSLVLGMSARRQGAPLAVERDRLRAAQREVTSFRSAFKPAAPGEEAVRFADTLAVGVAHESRISLAQRIAQQAEHGGLRDVRVRFAAPDTSSRPPSPELFSGSVALAPYTLVVEGDGSLSTVLSLVKGLPPAVALQRVTANRSPTGVVRYTVVLAVFETAEQSQDG